MNKKDIQDSFKISIVTPSFNQGQFLERTIKSVIEQNYKNIEHIIIDGGSTDESVNIIKKYEKKIAYWVSEKDTGQTNAINKGLARATGDIVAYLNSDDILLPGTLEKVNSYFNSIPSVGIIYGDCLMIDKDDNVLKIKKEISFDYKMGCMIGFGIIIIQPSTFWRKSVLRKVGYFAENYHYSMDEEYWFRCAVNNVKILHISDILSGFRWHDASKTKSTDSTISNNRFLEKTHLLENAYNTLPISNIIPFKISAQIRFVYRLKRVLFKFINGCYFNSRDRIDISNLMK